MNYDLKDIIAKALADKVGHGMREKCEGHADAVIAALTAAGLELAPVGSEAELSLWRAEAAIAMKPGAHPHAQSVAAKMQARVAMQLAGSSVPWVMEEVAQLRDETGALCNRMGARIAELEAQNAQVAEGKAQWDEVAKILGADGDNVDDVFTKAKAHAERARVPDGDRIDWMEANARSVSFGKAPQQGYWVHVQGVGYSHNESLRGAIDSAREAQAAAPSQPEDAA